MSPSDLRKPLHSHPPKVQLADELISPTWRAKTDFNTDRHAQSVWEFDFHAKNPLLRQQLKHPEVEFSATSQQGNRVCAYHPLN